MCSPLSACPLSVPWMGPTLPCHLHPGTRVPLLLWINPRHPAWAGPWPGGPLINLLGCPQGSFCGPLTHLENPVVTLVTPGMLLCDPHLPGLSPLWECQPHEGRDCVHPIHCCVPLVGDGNPGLAVGEACEVEVISKSRGSQGSGRGFHWEGVSHAVSPRGQTWS